jgi:hypothetical protein
VGESAFLLYESEPGRTRLLVRVGDETVWLSHAQMAELFQTTIQNVTMHIKAVFGEGELEMPGTCKDVLQVRQEGGRQVQRSLAHYNLDVIISVGHRVKSHAGTRFRIWATQRLPFALKREPRAKSAVAISGSRRTPDSASNPARRSATTRLRAA